MEQKVDDIANGIDQCNFLRKMMSLYREIVVVVQQCLMFSEYCQVTSLNCTRFLYHIFLYSAHVICWATYTDGNSIFLC